MADDGLTEFLSQLEDAGDLVRVRAEVDWDLEIAEITRRVCPELDGGPALFFEKVKGRSQPVVTNLLGSERRMCRALRVESLSQLAERVAKLIQPTIPDGLLETVKLMPQVSRLAKLPPQVVKTGSSQQVVKIGGDVNLRELPLLRSWPHEANPSITSGQVVTKDPVSGTRNVRQHLLEVRDHQSLIVHWNRHHAGRRHFEAHQRTGQQMPIAIALGGDPAMLIAAHAPLPIEIDECLLAGFLRDQSIELVRGRTMELEVPAHAEFVIEGRIDTTAALASSGLVAGPFGHYESPEELPVVHVTAITHRANPAYPAMIAGPPPTEFDWFGYVTERMQRPLIKRFVPELVDLHLPRAGAFANFVIVSLQKRYPGQARKVMNALWSLDGLMTTKCIIAVDAEVDVHDEEQVSFYTGAHVHPGRDLYFCEGPAHMSDHAAPIRGLGHKLGIDATRKWPEEGHTRTWPQPLEMSDSVMELVSRRWSEYGFASER